MIDELKTLIAVIECKSFTKAADAINLSQPSVSLHIRHLEEYFNTVLIKRSVKQKNIFITQEGFLLYERAKQIVKLLEDAKAELSDCKSAVMGKLHIGASFTIGEYFLPHFLGQFSKEYPDLELKVTIGNTHNICEKVKSFQVDIALIEGTVPPSDFIINHFYKDKMVLAVPYDHLLVKKAFSLKELKGQTWISREEGSGTREYLNLFLSANNINAKNIIVFGSNYSVKEAVKNNLGITLISSLVTKNPLRDKEISTIETGQQYTRPFSYILQKGYIPSKGVLVFIDMLKNYAKHMESI